MIIKMVKVGKTQGEGKREKMREKQKKGERQRWVFY